MTPKDAFTRDVFLRRTGAAGVAVAGGTLWATAPAAARARRLIGDDVVIVNNRAGAPLTVWPDAASTRRTFWVSGPAAIVFKGEI